LEFFKHTNWDDQCRRNRNWSCGRFDYNHCNSRRHHFFRRDVNCHARRPRFDRRNTGNCIHRRRHNAGLRGNRNIQRSDLSEFDQLRDVGVFEHADGNDQLRRPGNRCITGFTNNHRNSGIDYFSGRGARRNGGHHRPNSPGRFIRHGCIVFTDQPIVECFDG